MSQLTLGTITYSRSAKEPNNYVAGIPNSESGPLYPMLIREGNELNSLFGDFKYKAMYDRLLRHGIPSVLVPVITKVSPYNRASLRLNEDGAYVNYTHPRPGKNYNYRRQGNILVHRVTKGTKELELTTYSKYPVSYLLTNEIGLVLPHDIVTAKYIKEDSGFYRIQFKFDEEFIGTITIASYPSLEAQSSFMKVQQVYYDGAPGSSNDWTTGLSGKVFPDVVIVDDDGYEIVDWDGYLTGTSTYTYHIELQTYASGYAYLRLLTEDMVHTQYLASELTEVKHELGYFPKVEEFKQSGNTTSRVQTPIININKEQLNVEAESIESPKYAQYIHDTSGVVLHHEVPALTNRIVIQTSSKYHIPYHCLFRTDNGYATKVARVCYGFNDEGYSAITFEFDDYIIGDVYITRYPSLENGKDQFSLDLSTVDSFYIDHDTLPEVVTIDTQGFEVQNNVTLTPQENGKYLCKIEVNNPLGITAWVRVLDPSMLTTKELVSNSTVIRHGLNFDPASRVIVNDGGEISEYVAQLLYKIDATKQLTVQINNYKAATCIQYCIRTETDDTKVTARKIASDAITYSMILDFTDVSEEPTDDNQYLVLLVGGTRILYLKQNNTSESLIASDYYDEQVHLLSDDLYGMIDEIKKDLSERLTESRVLDFVDECCNSVKIAWDNANRTISDGEPGTETFTESAFDDWKEALFDSIYENELFLGSYKTLIDWLRTNLHEDSNLDSILLGIQKSEEFLLKKLLLNYDAPSYNLNFYGFNGLKLRSCFNSEQDILCEFTEDSKLIEFYSKLKGPQGAKTKITITDISKYYYEIKVELAELVEYHYVYTAKTDLTPDDAIDIHFLGQESNLITAKIYDYELPSGQIIDQFDFVDYFEMDQFDPDRVRIIELPEGEYQLSRNCDEYTEYEDWANTLNDLSDSGYFPDLLLVPEVFRGSELQQYKDIHSYVRGSELNSYGGICTDGVYSQALCQINWEYLQNPSMDKFPDANNRFLYFYGDLTIDNDLYPAFYPYIEAIIKGTGLTLPNEFMLSDPDSIKVGNNIVYHNQPYIINDVMEDTQVMCEDALGTTRVIQIKFCKKITELVESLHINYLQYNGLYYYYSTLREKIGQPSKFLIQYVCSKISREFKKAHGILVSTTYPVVQNPIINLISRILNITPYLSTLSHTLDYNERELRINLTAQIKGLVNRQFLVNYILNLT